VAAQLQPAVQLAVVGQQDPLPVGADQPCAAGEVAGQPFPQEGIQRIVQECAEFVSQCGLIRVAAGVGIKLTAQCSVRNGNGFGVQRHGRSRHRADLADYRSAMLHLCLYSGFSFG